MINRHNKTRFELIVVALACIGFRPAAANDGRQHNIGVSVPEGFSITQVAGDDLATNIYSLTVGDDGQIYVSGPGYIRQLLDDDGDGVTDRTIEVADLPKSGAQGLWSEGKTMLAVGDSGIWRFEFRPERRQARLQPRRMMKVGTSGEHYAHAIRQGPDGWFYWLGGNETPIPDEFKASPFSPIKVPRAGFLMRFSPDFKTGEIVAHGFRNAYDFDFNSFGEIFVYDSDGEREVSLPWYQPTRVFRIQPGDDAGWVSRTWKRPGYFFDMPQVVGELGRGSPTGVVCYNGQQFPSKYKDAIFTADWTFGKISVFLRDPATGEYDRGSGFAVAQGQFGFAVTDLAVADDGSLLISCGGRGTSGAIYRISYEGTTNSRSESESDTNAVRLSPMFLKRTEWSRDEWQQVLGMLVESNGGRSVGASPPGKSSRRRKMTVPFSEKTDDKVKTDDVRTAALEVLVGRAEYVPHDDEMLAALNEGLQSCLTEFDAERAKLVMRICKQLPKDRVAKIITDELPLESRLLIQLTLLADKNQQREFIEQILRGLNNSDHPLDLVRMGQLALEGCGPDVCADAFMGYAAINDIDFSANPEFWSNMVARGIVDATENGEPELARELGRLAAMLKLSGNTIQVTLMHQLQSAESPTESLHWLFCLAQTGEVDFGPVIDEIAETLLDLDQHMIEQELPQDYFWEPRLRALTKRIFDHTPAIAQKVAEGIRGRPGQVVLHEALPKELRSVSTQAFVDAVQSDYDQATAAQLTIVANVDGSSTIFRKAAEYDHLKDAALIALAEMPSAQDRSLFFEGLKSWDTKVVRKSAMSLRKLDIKNPSVAELMRVWKSLQKIRPDRNTVAARDELVRLMRQLTGQSFGYRFDRADDLQNAVIEQWRNGLRRRFPDEFQPDDHESSWRRLSETDLTQGDHERGFLLYKKLKCAQCHDGSGSLGPRLEGISKRFAVPDLLRAIAQPSEQIPDRYRLKVISTTDGRLYQGTVIYTSVDGVTLQQADGTTIRINADSIDEQRVSDQSLMPDGLLDEVTPEQWADLVAYLRLL